MRRATTALSLILTVCTGLGGSTVVAAAEPLPSSAQRQAINAIYQQALDEIPSEELFPGIVVKWPVLRVLDDHGVESVPPEAMRRRAQATQQIELFAKVCERVELDSVRISEERDRPFRHRDRRIRERDRAFR